MYFCGCEGEIWIVGEVVNCSVGFSVVFVRCVFGAVCELFVETGSYLVRCCFRFVVKFDSSV